MRAYIVMTAMPPTKGHLHLIQFATQLNDVESTEVILCTQPEEPYTEERYNALVEASRGLPNVNIHRMHRELPQEPTLADEAPFWDMWAGFLRDNGIQKGDYIVASEMYAAKLAERVGAIFMPYDLYRTTVYTKATDVRENPLDNFSQVLPEFQKYLRRTVTVFGAESTGKTTLAKRLADIFDGYYIAEWARPYLEKVENVITNKTMTEIWLGQGAMQRQARMMFDRPLIIQDTDLFSTVGYWDYMMESDTPLGLQADAAELQSDLYIVCRSNIPFEEDPLRYGGDRRETEDHHWTDLLDRYNLPYVVLDADSLDLRELEAYDHIEDMFEERANLNYQRRGREYETMAGAIMDAPEK